MSQKKITIAQLYSQDMNIYGDWGNVLTLQRRLEWRGYDVELIEYNQGDNFPQHADILVGGGGQDSGQDVIQKDLLKIGSAIASLAEQGVPMLMICGLYQLFGHFFKTQEGHVIEGIGLLNIETYASPQRLIGNTVVESAEFGTIIGYENHSGKTFLARDTKPLGKVVKGAGNNGEDGYEGVRYKNIIGSYLHGSLLPKNPAIADFLIEKAVLRKYGEFNPHVIDDSFAQQARAIALKRPR